jgi:hypothetical protein
MFLATLGAGLTFAISAVSYAQTGPISYPDWWIPLTSAPSGHVTNINMEGAQRLPNAPGYQILVDSEVSLDSHGNPEDFNAAIKEGLFSAVDQNGAQYGCTIQPSGEPLLQCTIVVPGPGTYVVNGSVLDSRGIYIVAKNPYTVVIN